MSSKNLFSFLFLLVLLFSSFSEATAWIRSGFWYAGSEFPVPEIPSTLFTHIHFAFAYINTSSFELYISHSDEPYISTFSNTVKQKNPSVITLLSIWGGRDESPDFFAMTSQFSRRKSFITTSIKTARQYGFQGLDLFGVNPNTDANMTNMRSFIEEWRTAINSESKSFGTKRLILTMGAYYSPMLDSMSYPVDTIIRNFDWVHLIAYDYYLPTKDNFTGPHAALYDPTSKLNTDHGIKEWIKRGLPANKIVLGLAYHGYAWTLVNPKRNTVRSPARGLAITRDGSMSYRYIKRYMKSYGVTPVYNSTFVVNYVTIGSFWIGYDDVEAIRTKVSYAKDKGLLGFAAFQIPSDDVDWELSKAAKGEEEDQSSSNRRLLAILLPTLTLAILLLSTIVCILKKKTIRSEGIRELNERAIGRTLKVFSFDQIKAATDNFSIKNKLGEGGFGPVYKGRLSDGQEIAVKRLSACSKQGIEEFQNEVTLASKLQHVNVLQLQGFCIEREEKILVYEYMPNKSLDFYLYDPVQSLQLDWEMRVRIIEGVTQGLLYLQEYSAFTVIHRDLKASNILLDDEMKPKISDFGIAKLFQKDEKEANTGRIVGTYGCVPPEYVKRGVYSRKYDVYSFGVLLLQILGGKKNSSEYGIKNDLNLLEYAYELWGKGNGVDFLDLSLQDDSRIGEQLRYMQVALLCVQEKWEDRPSMLEVYSMLKNETEVLPNPKVPAFSKNKDNDTQETLVTPDLTCSDNNLTISQLIAR
ncbi:PREDICTED: tyrosine-protein kinase receptor svh-2-like isoform X2 [Nicotiana attenuata]|uniref:non-specific serine/threonine protein kinase n=1 Tax=Nicotiana attenuata TaxID=49451 RepID=A0A1J6HWD9_NICAT|nr:PREDICTED: tyrosine-protein kinase receptor svh-2-like isoform X2 [Nicotiana attenuata]OIS97180.1 g-type lectin s-receptor-like serinethreonine-protein kinase [Nicotiana attenuata]